MIWRTAPANPPDSLVLQREGFRALFNIADLGIPTLDGLGPEGEGAHAAHEHVLTESFPRRAALVAGLLHR